MLRFEHFFDFRQIEFCRPILRISRRIWVVDRRNIAKASPELARGERQDVVGGANGRGDDGFVCGRSRSRDDDDAIFVWIELHEFEAMMLDLEKQL